VRLPAYVPLSAVVVGGALALMGALRPAFVWNLGRIELGRRWIGDGGVTAFMIVIGSTLIVLGVTLWSRLGRRR
jgi:hypothetical protein